MKRHQLIWTASSILLLMLFIMSSSVHQVVGQSSTPTRPLIDIASIEQTATALSTLMATPQVSDMPALGMPVVGKQWQVTVQGTSNADSLVDPFGDTYRADPGLSILLLSITVENLGKSAALPKADMLLSGIKFYSSANPPPSAFHLSKLAIHSDKDERFRLVGFGVGGDAGEFLIAPNLTDFSAAFDGVDPTSFTLAFTVPEKTVVTTLSFEFEDLPRIALKKAVVSKPTPTTDANTGTISGTLYVSRVKNVPMANVEVALNDPSKDVKSPAYKVATVKTDAAGKFLFSSVKPGRYLLSATWALSNAGSLTCSLSGFMTFRDDWLIATAKNQRGVAFIIAVKEFDKPVVAGGTLVADMDLACT